MAEIIQSVLPWWTGSVLQWVILGAACALAMIVAISIPAGNSIDPHERERDDEGQALDVSQPAPLRPHVRGGTAYGEPL